MDSGKIDHYSYKNVLNIEENLSEVRFGIEAV